MSITGVTRRRACPANTSCGQLTRKMATTPRVLSQASPPVASIFCHRLELFSEFLPIAHSPFERAFRSTTHADLGQSRLSGLANIMSSDRELGEPFTIATLPKPSRSGTGRTHVASVHSINGIKKRKRTEVVVGLDGEGLSIYAVCESSMQYVNV